MYFKRFIALILTVAMLFSMTAIFVQAADSEEDELKDIKIYNSGESLSCLAVSGRVQTLNYVYYLYRSKVTGETKEIPTYCVNPTTDGVPQKVKPGESIDYIIGERASDPKIMGIIANGYPTYRSRFPFFPSSGKFCWRQDGRCCWAIWYFRLPEP